MLEGKILLLFFFACFSVTTPTKLLAQGAWSFFNTISAPALDSLQQQIYDSASVKPFVQNLTIKSYNDPENLLSAHSISLASGFTSSYTSTRTRIDVIDDSSFVWRGAIDTTGDVVISVTKGAIWGYITALTDTLEFLSLSDTLCIMYRVDVTQVPDSCVADTSTSSMNGNPPNQSVGNKPPEHNIKHNGKKKGEQILTHCDGSPIKVLFLYTERTLADLGSIPNIKAKVK